MIGRSLRAPAHMTLIAMVGFLPGARAQRPASGGCAAFSADAASRAGLPVDMVTRVMRAESGGQHRAVSVKGAIGCMQIMPSTWAYLSKRYQLGSDPFDARSNMIGGALFLAELRARFGIPGAFAAYNAGPSRYARLSATHAALPLETVAYVKRLGGVDQPNDPPRQRARWQEAVLFMIRDVSTADEAKVPVDTPAPARPSVDREPVQSAGDQRGRSLATLFPLSSNADNGHR